METKTLSGLFYHEKTNGDKVLDFYDVKQFIEYVEWVNKFIIKAKDRQMLIRRKAGRELTDGN